ncbi:hypothetical protein [Bartonella sp. B30(2025)]
MKMYDSIGNLPYKEIKKAHIAAGIERRKKTSAMARNFLKTFSALLIEQLNKSF